MIRKLFHKKWLFLCLLLGSILLIATVTSYPMYRNAVFNRMLQDELSEAYETSGKWPTVINNHLVSDAKEHGADILELEKYATGLYDRLEVKEAMTVFYYVMAGQKASRLVPREDDKIEKLRLAYLSGLGEHVKLIEGRLYSESGLSDDGAIEVVVTQATMLKMGLVVGEKIRIDGIRNLDGSTPVVEIVGIIERQERDDPYWQMNTDSIREMYFMNEKLFRDTFLTEDGLGYSFVCETYSLMDYTAITSTQTRKLIADSKAEYRSEHEITLSPLTYVEVLENYQSGENRISVTLFILQVPVMLLLVAFLFMLSGQMFELEKNEISVLKSRGSSKSQIFFLYLMQSMLLSAGGLVLGLPLGSVFCRILGSANNFLEFGIRKRLFVAYTPEVFLFALGGAFISVLIMTLPTLKHARLSIVHLKQSKATGKRSWWEKCFLDVIFLAIAVYGYYNFHKNADSLVLSALKNEPLDPLLYVSSSLFILGAGMLLLRLQPVIVGFFFLLGKRHMGPASYASFRETIKNGRKQQYIMLFLILTVSLGMFNAVSARTIVKNTINNTDYLTGADIVMQEPWEDNSSYLKYDPSLSLEFYEPDTAKFAHLEDIKGYTKVYVEEQAYVSIDSRNKQSVKVMGIHTKEFGQLVELSDELLEKPYYEYLNELAVMPSGVLVSKNFRDILGYRVGDFVPFTNTQGVTIYGQIADFIEYWPGYSPTKHDLALDGEVTTGENYLIVANLTALQQQWGMRPYQVWIRLNDDKDASAFYSWLDRYDVKLKSYSILTKEEDKAIENPLLQGMNGVLTMSFIVMVILCAVGYLIYWVLSIRSREMMFGILRAFGMHKEELFHMLVNEQIFCGIYSILAGIGIGTVAYKMFVPMLQMAYSSTAQVLPLTMVVNASDILGLYAVVGGMMFVCLFVLAIIVNKLNITKALKLGEE